MPSNSFCSPLLKQIWVASGILLNVPCLGMTLSFPSSILPAVLSPNSDIKMDFHMASWFASSVGLSSILGFFLASFFMENFGRRKAYLLMLTPMISGWLLIYAASNTTMLMMGRILCGIGAGSATTLGSVCVGEYTNPVYRGVFLSLKSTFTICGSISVHILNNFYSWKTIALISSVPSILSFFISLTWPESPPYLAYKKQFKECSKEFFWLRGRDEKSTNELEELIRGQKNRLENRLAFKDNCTASFGKFTRKDFLKPVSILVVCLFLMESSGRHVFPAYLPRIITLIIGNEIESAYFTFGLDIIVLVSSITSNVLVKLLNRRTLFFATGSLAVFTLALNSMYLFLVSRSLVPNTSSIPISLLAIYLLFINFGCSSLPILFFGELLPLEHKGVGTIVGGVGFSLAMYLILQVTPYLLASVNVYGTFAVFGVLMSFFFAILYFILPETKDRTLQEIENFFRFGEYAVVCGDGNMESGECDKS